MSIIKPTHFTRFPAGTKVVVTDTGETFSTYKDMADFIGLSGYVDGISPFKHGNVGIVIGSGLHHNDRYGEVLGIQLEGSDVQGLISTLGVEVKEFIEVGELAAVKVELAETKAKLWDAEQKLKKIAAVAAEVAS